jgi:hypothetical protein
VFVFSKNLGSFGKNRFFCDFGLRMGWTEENTSGEVAEAAADAAE